MNRENLKFRINTNKILFCFIFLLFLLFPSILPAQTFPTRHYTMRDGLPSMGIRCIYKDSRGLIWVGTDSGLCSFDGKSFRIFKPSEGMTASQVWAITEDNDGNLWFGSFGEGIYKYNGHTFKQYTTKHGLLENAVRVMSWSKKYDCLVAAGYEGISVIKEDTVKSLKNIELGIKNIRSASTGVIDAGDFLFITYYHGNAFFRFYPDKMLVKAVYASNKNYPTFSFSGLIKTNGDTVFTNADKGIRIINKSGYSDVDCTGQIFNMSDDRRGNIWFAVWSYPGRPFDSGIYRYDGKILKNYKSALGITDKEIWTVYCDKEQDVVWVGTLNEGLFKISSNSGIERFPPSFFNLEKNRLADLFIDSKNRLWVSGSNELIVMDSTLNYSTIPKMPIVKTFKQFWNNQSSNNFNSLGLDEKQLLNTPDSKTTEFVRQFSFNFTRSIEDSKHEVYFSNKLGLFKIAESFLEIKYLGNSINNFDYNFYGSDTILSTRWGPTLLFTGFKNINSASDHQHFYYLKEKTDSVSTGKPLDVNRLVKKGQQFWYATMFSGLWMSEQMQLTNFNKTDSTISNSLNDICFDEKGHVIFGSNTGEICIATYNDNQLRIDYRINSDNGLQGTSISWLVADQKGNLWAGTNLGLNCIDLDELYLTNKTNIRFIDEEYGYTGHSSKKAVIDNDGNLWIGADDNLIRFNTNSFLSSAPESGKVVLKSLEINHTSADSLIKSEVNPWTLAPAGNFKLVHTENDLIFYFDVLNYIDPGKDRFRYTLKGYDDEWSHWNTGRRAVYTNLSPGRYTLCIESYNLRTLLHAKPLMFEFTIRHPWWELWHLQFAVIALLLAMAVLITRKYTRAEKSKQQQKLEIEKKIVELEMQALQAQMNPHFIFNCMNGIQYFVLANKMDEVLAYLSDFSKVVSQSLGSATLRMVPLEQEIDFLKSYLRLEQMRFPDKFEYDIRCCEGDDASVTFLPPMLIQPFAENAIRHGFVNLRRKGHISIEFEKKEKDLLKCTIIDNGIGREKARLKNDATQKNDRSHSGMITETRVRLFNSPDSPNRYKIVYTDLPDNGKSRGLKVELYLPMETGLTATL